jgi:hypothetical protein
MGPLKPPYFWLNSWSKLIRQSEPTNTAIRRESKQTPYQNGNHTDTAKRQKILHRRIPKPPLVEAKRRIKQLGLPRQKEERGGSWIVDYLAQDKDIILESIQ